MKNGKWETSLKERISYGLSDGADNLIFQVMTTYLLYFYTDVFGLNPGSVAVLFVVARFFDFIESPIVGLMIDHNHSHFGKSRSFFLWFAIPYVIFAILTFITPNLSNIGKLIWAYITYLGLGFFYTTVNLPITSILPSLTKNGRETTLLGVIRQFFGSSVQIIVGTFTIPLVAFFGQGNEKLGFLGTIILFSLISLFLILNTFFWVRERHTNIQKSFQPIKKVWQMLKKNKPWIILSIIIFLYWLVTAIKNQTIIYYFKYIIQQKSLVSLANGFTFTSLIGVILIMYLTYFKSKKKVMGTGIIIEFIGQIVIGFGAYSHFLAILFFGIVINSVGNGIVIGLVSIMIADTINYGTNMGIQAEGLLASSDDFGVNLGLGVGGLITSGLFDLSGYKPNQVQNSATLNMINVNFVWIPIVIYIVMFICLLFYQEKKMPKISN